MELPMSNALASKTKCRNVASFCGLSRTLTFMVGLFGIPSVNASDLSLELRIGGYNTDNVGRTAALEEDQTVLSAGTTVSVSGETLRTEGGLVADLDFLSFRDDAFDDEVLPEVRGDFTLKALPDRVHWLTEARYGVVRRSPLDASTPENRELASFVSTGPIVVIPVGSRSSLQLDSRFGANTFEESETDSESLSGGMSFNRALSPRRTLSLRATGQRVEYDTDFGLQDFETYAAFLALESEISRGSLTAQLGRNEVHANGETFSGTLASIQLDRKLSASSSLGVSVNQRYTDAGSYFGGLDTVFRPGLESSVVPVRNPFESRQLRASYSYDKGRHSLTVNAGSSSFIYETDNTFDSDRTELGLSVTSELGNSWSVRGRLRLEDRDFETLDRNDTYAIAALSVDRSLSRTLSISLEYRYEDRDSDADGQDYIENRLTLQFRYTPEI